MLELWCHGGVGCGSPTETLEKPEKTPATPSGPRGTRRVCEEWVHRLQGQTSPGVLCWGPLLP